MHSTRGFIKLEDTVIVTDQGTRSMAKRARLEQGSDERKVVPFPGRAAARAKRSGAAQIRGRSTFRICEGPGSAAHHFVMRCAGTRVSPAHLDVACRASS